MIDEKDSLNSNYEPKSTFITDTEEMECNDKINVSNVSNVNVFKSTYIYVHEIMCN